MMKRLAATGVLAMAVGGALLGASPAMAHGDEESESESHSKNVQGLGIQICQLPVNVIPIVSPITTAQDDCLNGSSKAETDD